MPRAALEPAHSRAGLIFGREDFVRHFNQDGTSLAAAHGVISAAHPIRQFLHRMCHNDIGRNHGFVDLRGRPDFAIEIPEGSQSPALKAILVELSEPDSPLFTLGCDLGTHEEPWRVESARHVAGGYVQLMCASYSDRSPEDYTTFGYAIAQVLGEKAQDYNWFVRFVLKLVVLSLEDFSGAAPSLWIWFYAIAETPEAALASRESLIGELHRALVDERFTSFFEEERDDAERTYP